MSPPGNGVTLGPGKHKFCREWERLAATMPQPKPKGPRKVAQEREQGIG